jgi:hypothetical protein
MLLTRRRQALLALLVVAAPALLLLAPLAAQAQDADAAAEALEVDVDNAGCFGHHAAETPPFRTTVLLLPAPLAEVPAGQEFDLPVQVQVAWKQEMRNLKVGINLSEAPNLAFVGEHEPFSLAQPVTVPRAQSVEVPFPVEANATVVTIVMDGDPGVLGGNDLDLVVISPEGAATYNKTLEDNSLEGIRTVAGGQASTIADETLVLDQGQVLDGGLGSWKAVITFTDGQTPTADASVQIDVQYGGTPEILVPVDHTLLAGELTNVTFHLRAVGPGPAVVGVRSLGWAYYKHTDAQAVDDGNFSKSQKMAFTVGSTLRFQSVAGVGPVGVTLDPAAKLMRQWGFLLGWAGFFLIPPSLLMGGTFGGGTVRSLNKIIGTARQRVLWHNAMSYMLLAIALTHMTLFLFEVTYNWTIGVVWGSLTLASMIGLGVTGALQNRIAKAWGYGTWRFTHFLLGMLVVAFIALHVMVDGVDFQFLRDYFLTPA